MLNLSLCFSKSLQFYRGSNYDIAEELNEIFQRHEEKSLQSKDKNGCCSSIQRIISPAFGRPFFIVGVIFLLNQWGEFTNLVMNMIQIFKDSKSSIEPELAPVFVGVVQVNVCFSFISSINWSKLCLLSNQFTISFNSFKPFVT